MLALVGTDHHPFDRFVDWIDAAARARPYLRFVVQHGASRTPRVAQGRVFLPHDELASLVEAAAAVVCHGGPGTIMDARAAGHVPICVPRDPSLGEHVDGHQLRFAELVDSTGVARTVRPTDGPAALGAALEHALAARRLGRAGVPDTDVTDHARAVLAQELDQLIEGWARRTRVRTDPDVRERTQRGEHS